MREAALVPFAGGVAGALLSLLVGPLLGRWIVGRASRRTRCASRRAPLALAVGAASMFVVGLCGAWLAARRAARVRPAEALRDAAVDRGVMTVGRWLIGLPSLAGATALSFLNVGADAGGPAAARVRGRARSPSSAWGCSLRCSSRASRGSSRRRSAARTAC